jgi:hypothetical protein
MSTNMGRTQILRNTLSYKLGVGNGWGIALGKVTVRFVINVYECKLIDLRMSFAKVSWGKVMHYINAIIHPVYVLVIYLRETH